MPVVDGGLVVASADSEEQPRLNVVRGRVYPRARRSDQVVGMIDAFNQSKIYATNKFNLSAVTTVAILFVLITIPQARFVDRLLERDSARTRGGG